MKLILIFKSGTSMLFYLLTICPGLANTAPKPLKLNLALVDPGSTIKIQGNRTIDSIFIENVINGKIYSVEINKEAMLLPPLEYIASIKKDFVSPPASCLSLIQAIDDLKAFQERNDGTPRNEGDLAALTNKVKLLMFMNDCTNNDVKNAAEYWLHSSTKVLDEKIAVEAGKVVTIIIRRDDLEWKFIYEGDAPGKWVTTYGFGFTTNGLRGNSYYTKQIPDTSVFEILKSRGPKAFDLSYVPAVFFTFFPSNRTSKSWNHSLTGGLGFDLVSPVLYFGYNGLYWHNIGFSAGLAFQQQNVLRDQFEVNDKLSMFMDSGQLHEKVYRPNLFISIHFRIDKNPSEKAANVED